MTSNDPHQELVLTYFTVEARALIRSAQELADGLGSRRLETAHLLAVALERPSVVAALCAAGANEESLRKRADAALGVVQKSAGERSYFSPAMLAMITHLESRRGDNERITVSTLLSALVNSPDKLSEVFRRVGVAAGVELVVAEAPPERPPVLRLERYQRDAWQLLALAQALADRLRHATVEPIHLLVTLAQVDNAAVAAFAGANGIDMDDALAKATPAAPGELAGLSPAMLALLAAAEQAASAEVTIPDLWRAVRRVLDSASETTFALLHPPPPDPTVSRRDVPEPFLETLMIFLAKYAGTRRLEQRQRVFTLTADCGDGRSVRVVLAPDRFEILGVPLDAKPVRDRAGDIVKALQRSTGWHLTYATQAESTLSDCVPAGACRACNVEVFAWEEACPSCGARVAGPAVSD